MNRFELHGVEGGVILLVNDLLCVKLLFIRMYKVQKHFQMLPSETCVLFTNIIHGNFVSFFSKLKYNCKLQADFIVKYHSN